MKLLYVTPEIAPWAKTGGLGDVSAALPQALAALGIDVRVLVPAFAAFDRLPATPIADIQLPGNWPAARLLQALTPEGLPLLLLDCPALYRRAGGPYVDAAGGDYADNALRFGLLARVAAQLSMAGSPLGWQPDVLHGHDWTCGLAPLYLHLAREDGHATAASVLTIHNLAFQGWFALEEAQALGIPPASLSVGDAGSPGRFSMLKAGLQAADAITTVSPTYAREITTDAFGCGMQSLLQARAYQLHGILNGIDTTLWNPASDPLLPANFDVASLAGKAQCKAALQAELGLPQNATVPLAGLVGRLTGQKGIDLVVDCIGWMRDHGVQLAVLGQGDPALEAALHAASAAHPDQIQVRTQFDEGLAHRIEAGADFFLMPSRFEPCGLNQMYSQRYGTPPLVHATGGLADSVTDLDAPGATGVVMQAPTAAALQHALARMLDAWRDPVRWRALQQSGMARYFGWADSARRYAGLYAALAGAPTAGSAGH